MGSSPELHVLHGVKPAYKSQDLLHQPGLERASTGMPDQRTTCAATQGMNNHPVCLSERFGYLWCTFVCITYTAELIGERAGGQDVQIDFRAAFDRVNRQGILYKLSSVGIGGSVLSVLTQFLSNRSQYVIN